MENGSFADDEMLESLEAVGLATTLGASLGQVAHWNQRLSTGRAPFQKSLVRAEGLDFRPDFWKFRRPVLAYFRPFWTF